MSEPTVTTVPIPRDETPFTDLDDIEQDEAPYGYTASGRIRKRPIGSRVGDASPRKAGMSNEKLARQAAALLAQVNNIVAVGLTIAGMPGTASAIANANDGFEEQAYNALLPDPALCRSIVRVGGTSSKVSLLIAYGMFTVQIAPVAVMEARSLADFKKARKAEARTEASGNHPYAA